ncbi:unnamed protein product [Caenorhabditis brenneri]
MSEGDRFALPQQGPLVLEEMKEEPAVEEKAQAVEEEMPMVEEKEDKGPIVEEEMPVDEERPSGPAIPIEWIRSQMRLFGKDVDEEGMALMAIAEEAFMREVLRAASNNGTREIDYDNFADTIQEGKNNLIKEFFPRRVRYGDIKHLLFKNQQGGDQSTAGQLSSSSGCPPADRKDGPSGGAGPSCNTG